MDTVLSILTRRNTAYINVLSGFAQILTLIASLLMPVFTSKVANAKDVFFVVLMAIVFVAFIASVINFVANINNRYNMDHTTATIGNSIYVIFFLLTYVFGAPMTISVLFVIPSFAITSVGAALELLPQ